MLELRKIIRKATPPHVRAAWRGCASVALAGLCMLTACAVPLPEPPDTNLPTQPVVLDITPAPTLDIDATATAMANLSRATPTPTGLYIVQPGDTLSALAEQFNTTVEEILVANDMSDPNNLQAGQELIIPSLLPTPLIGDPAAEMTTTTTISPTGTITATAATSPTTEAETEAEEATTPSQE